MRSTFALRGVFTRRVASNNLFKTSPYRLNYQPSLPCRLMSTKNSGAGSKRKSKLTGRDRSYDDIEPSANDKSFVLYTHAVTNTLKKTILCASQLTVSIAIPIVIPTNTFPMMDEICGAGVVVSILALVMHRLHTARLVTEIRQVRLFIDSYLYLL